MMKSILTLVLGLSAAAFAQPVKADIIKCAFTEPFMSTEYSMAQQAFTIVDPISEYPKVIRTVIKNVSFQIKGSNKFELVGADKKVIQFIDLNFKGSDGMSDYDFPYAVKWLGDYGPKTGLFGGCESNYLKAVESVEN